MRYSMPLTALAVVSLVVSLAYQRLGPGHLIINGLLSASLLLILLGAAWLGYGPGLLITALVSFAVPKLAINPSRPHQPFTSTVLQFGLLSVISLLVSRIASGNRRRETDLRKAAWELEQRVQERTAEALESAVELREQATLLDLAHDAILSMDWDGTIRFWNKGAERMYGWKADEARGKISHELLRTEFPEPQDQIERKLAEKGHWHGELHHTTRDGRRLVVVSRWAVRRGPGGEPKGYLEINTDATERRRLEEQLRHTQKLESLGVLAGGVAHDFNNLLTGILGNASLALDSMPAVHQNREFLQEVIRAAEHAADLTRQLLAYAGKGRFIVKTIDLSELVRDISGLVQTSVPKSVTLRLQLAEGLPGIEADPGQMQQIVMNLVINAAEAIGGEGGTVTVRTGLEKLDDASLAAISAPTGADPLEPGEYVCLEVHDTGSGMSRETLAKIFDPFFTTKFAGRGLGLSAVLGIVRSHKGALQVDSRPGQGTTFRVFFPTSMNRVARHAPPAAGDLTGSGTVLVVDDEEVVRSTARHTLQRYGYDALAAENGAQALEVYRENAQAIRLILLDLTMPVMSGEETLRQLQRIDPAVRVLLTSGYNEAEAVQRFAGKGLAGFLQKPYTAAELARKVKQAMATEPRP